MMKYRTEKDTMGEVKVPINALWGPQTERSLQNFNAGPVMPISIIRSLLNIKKAVALSNYELNNLEEYKSNLIVKSVDNLLKLSDKELQNDFPLHIYQTGSGTQTNMNVNEVISNESFKINNKVKILPNDDVNRSQSTNDTFSTAMNISALLSVQRLKSALKHLISILHEKEKKYWKVPKIGRTHLQDATPLTFGQEISGWRSTLEHDLSFISKLDNNLLELPLGGTAVGTGLNTPYNFLNVVEKHLNKIYNMNFKLSTNKFYGLTSHSGLNVIHGSIKTLASDLIKIANDIRLLSSGPRCGYGELNIPANEPGSSIMPGKINPTQAEAITMASVRVMGNDTIITIASSQGNFELNVYKPLIIYSFLESVDILTKTIIGFADKMVLGLTINEDRMTYFVENSLMLITALSPHIGYDACSRIVKLAEKEKLTLKEAAISSGLVSEKQYDMWVDPIKMTNI